MGGAEGCRATVSTVMAVLCPQHHFQPFSPWTPVSPLVLSAYLVTTGPLHEHLCLCLQLSPQPPGSSFSGC